ncbi:hypothetical protein CFP56_020444 [Quercus suber]|uniref:Uncharacterized protein n=1 Tax=Quercus suber TaxID=58331 RepID=A0AAW0LZG9_QUESU
MGSKSMELSAHLADLTFAVPISPAQRRSRLPTSSISLLPFIFFLSSSIPHQSRLTSAISHSKISGMEVVGAAVGALLATTSELLVVVSVLRPRPLSICIQSCCC